MISILAIAIFVAELRCKYKIDIGNYKIKDDSLLKKSIRVAYLLSLFIVATSIGDVFFLSNEKKSMVPYYSLVVVDEMKQLPLVSEIVSFSSIAHSVPTILFISSRFNGHHITKPSLPPVEQTGD